MLRVALVLVLLGATAGMVVRYLRRRPGIPLVCLQTAHGVAMFLVAIPAFFLGQRLSDAAFGSPPADSPAMMFVYASGGVWLFLTAVILYQRARAGSLLLDLGPTSKRRTIAIAGALFALLGALALRRGGPEGPFWFAGALWLAVQVGRLQLRQAGVWMSHTLIRWPDIVGYTAEEGGAVRLQVRYALLKPKLRVPEARREEFLRVLKEHAALASPVVGR